MFLNLDQLEAVMSADDDAHIERDDFDGPISPWGSDLPRTIPCYECDEPFTVYPDHNSRCIDCAYARHQAAELDATHSKPNKPHRLRYKTHARTADGRIAPCRCLVCQKPITPRVGRAFCTKRCADQMRPAPDLDDPSTIWF